MATLSSAHPTAPDVRLDVQTVTRPTHGGKSQVSINPHALYFRPYRYAGPTPVESLTKSPRKA